ncbi:MAG: DUF1214 domain-containing protein [Burkholderiaceae bacterium]|uniref:DUF1214 domain-containing protein n=1 Tax=Cupriavidus metallidurans TaxID=119219 RepID=A0A482IXU5_9BURK|nr:MULTISPECIES: DUF1214 domain-containing protein [Cupriavidus]PCH58664.1 MAG: DUF1214 domain-containing protein [Burkholderiaceae bacterium]QBP13915.1 DUF1214 domain-containing protein [Cupriavidus metallidurans]QWC91695.1 DUF1214 domain-containing protein [Cupriavidus metallidurans]
MKDVPVDGFWSVSVYNAEGYLQKNPANAYILASTSSRKPSRRSDLHRIRLCPQATCRRGDNGYWGMAK